MGSLNAFVIFACSLALILNISLAETFDVTDFGAKGNENDDDSKAFLSAWAKTCASIDSATMMVPEGKTFLVNPLQFKGPCKGKTTQVQIDGNIVAPKSPSEWSGCSDNTWISFSNINYLHVRGNGKLDAQGSTWWKKNTQYVYEINAREYTYERKGTYKKGGGTGKNPKKGGGGGGGGGGGVGDGGSCKRPTGLRFENCNNLELNGLTHVNPPGRHLNIYGCNHVQISDITITAPGESPNTDGIAVSSSTYVNIVNSIIGTGDDCVAISTGTSNILVEGVQCGPGHGISVGSLGMGGSTSAVNGVYVKNCSFTRTTNGVRIKTWQGGKGYARNITFEDIQLNNVKNCIIIDQNYHDGSRSLKNSNTAVALSDVKYTNVRGTSALKQAILLDCSSVVPCKDIVFDQVNITSNNDIFATCNNAEVSGSETVSPTLKCQ